MNKAMEYYFRAAELGSSMAHYNIANEYYFGKVIEKDMEKAIYHVKLAAMEGMKYQDTILGLQKQTMATWIERSNIG